MTNYEASSIFLLYGKFQSLVPSKSFYKSVEYTLLHIKLNHESIKYASPINKKTWVYRIITQKLNPKSYQIKLPNEIILLLP